MFFFILFVFSGTESNSQGLDNKENSIFPTADSQDDFNPNMDYTDQPDNENNYSDDDAGISGSSAENNDENDADTAGNEIELRPVIVKGSGRSGWKKTNIQEVSRHTMTVSDLKEVPASFGDSLNALTALPGIIRAGGGLFGPLVIRGADVITNNYFIDDIPINDPMHFGGLHSVINTNLMSEIDVYASAFPAEFGSATSAIINITTIDEVTEFGGYTDLSLLSASALVKTPILKDKYGQILFDYPSSSKIPQDTENVGYMIASGRYGYITLGIKAAELITGDEIPFSPEYWDYQFKAKYKFSSVNSVTLLLFGHKDFIRFLVEEDLLEEGDDPLLADAKFQSDVTSHNQGFYLDSKFSSNFSNRLLGYSSMPDTYFYVNFGSEAAASWAKDLNGHYRPWVYGIKDKVKRKWLSGHAEFRGAAEYTFYYFTATGKTLLPANETTNSGPINISDEDAFLAYQLDEKITNHLYGGYLENKFAYWGLTVVPGIRSEYLVRMKETTFDPRLMLSYKFPTYTTLSAAGGHYSYFFQTNPFIFNNSPDISAISKGVKPEKAWHSVLGIEQEIKLFTIKLEGFNNYFYDKPQAYPHYEPDGSFLQGLSSGKMKTYGFEIMVRKDSKENENGFFGWLSYTYTQSKVKTGLPTEDGLYGLTDEEGNYLNQQGDPYGDQWITSDYEQRHCFKLISGYRFGNHTISGRFQYYTGFPYTPYVDGELDTIYYNITGEERYYPIPGRRNSKNFPPYYRLDLRYTHKINHSWGNISWYVEVINVFMTKAVDTQKWYYNSDYKEGSNPEIIAEEGFSFLPNFGVEVKF